MASLSRPMQADPGHKGRAAMPGGPRSLPRRPSLRYLKLEAKRRLAAGEFAALHDAQAAIAWEHGLPNWTALKQLICGQAQQQSHALAQVRWVIARFRDAGEPGWIAPDDDELRLHFDDQFLSEVPAAELIAAITSVAADLREEPTVIGQAPLSAHIQIGGLEVFAAAEANPPHRLTGLQAPPLAGGSPTLAWRHRRLPVPSARFPLRWPGSRMRPSPSWAWPPWSWPAAARTPQRGWLRGAGRTWTGGGVLDPGHRFPALGIAALVTATAVLRLIADGRVGLDSPASECLRVVRLADDTITVRELLRHTAGVDSPSPAELFADTVPDLVTLAGPVIACSGTRGVVRPSNGGYAVLGQLIADVTGSPYRDAVTRLVLEPLKMHDSSFPARSADLGPDAVSGYNVTPEGTFVPVPAMISTIPAVGGLWATGADLVRLGTGWSSLLPAALAREALTPQVAPEPGGRRVGLGWLISTRGDVAVHAGAGPGSTASLLVRIRDNQVHLTMTNRMIPIDPINDRVLRSWTNPTH